jgi:alpha-glucosidase
LPIMRALFLEYPNDPHAYAAEGQFLLGKELLVAPVVEKGASVKRIYFPEGEWIDFLDHRTLFKGPQWIDYPVTLESIPLFVRKGSIIPMMPIMQYIHEEKNYPITLRVFPSSIKSHFELYEDDGESNDYKKDVFSKTGFTTKAYKDKLEIEIAKRIEAGFSPEARDFILEVPLAQKPTAIILDNVKIKGFSKIKTGGGKEPYFIFDKQKSICRIYLADDGERKIIHIR